MNIEVLSYLAMVLVLSAVYFISKPRLRGQYLIIAADVTWFVYGVLTAQYALMVQSTILLCIGLSAVRNWRKENIPF